MTRFSRNYELTMSRPGDVAAVKVVPPMRISFQADKSIRGQLNKIQLKIYNMIESRRLQIVKDPEDQKIINISLAVGYQNSLESVFRGTIHQSSNERQGADIITTIEGLDGGYDFLNSYTSRTVEGSQLAVDSCLGDMPNTATGKITERPPLTRPKVLVGNSVRLLEEMVGPDETWFIDDEQFCIMKDDEVISRFVPKVSPATGLISTPTRKNKEVTFATLMNPAVKIGRRAELESTTAPHLNGVYKMDTISYQGDNFGDEWSQTCTGRLAAGVKVL